MILTAATSARLTEELGNKRLVFTDGVFDLLHPGHLAFLESISHEGEALLVCVLSDEWVRARKGVDRPILSGPERLEMVNALKCVDYVILASNTETNEPMPVSHLLKQIKPDLFITTDNSWEGRNREFNEWGIQLKIVPRVDKSGISTTNLIRRIRG